MKRVRLTELTLLNEGQTEFQFGPGVAVLEYNPRDTSEWKITLTPERPTEVHIGSGDTAQMTGEDGVQYRGRLDFPGPVDWSADRSIVMMGADCLVIG